MLLDLGGTRFCELWEKAATCFPLIRWCCNTAGSFFISASRAATRSALAF